MNAFTQALKSEIARVARKELKDELSALRKTVTGHRSEIASLKREVKTLRSQLKAGAKRGQASALPAESDESAAGRRLRFSAPAFAAQRAKLGLSQAQMAQLLGVSTLSVYKWESGKVRPRAAQLERIASIRRLGKREAAARLAGA